MKYKVIPASKLKMADEFQQGILNPKKRRGYRSFAYIQRQYKICPKLFVAVYKNGKLIGILFGYVKRSTVLIGEMAIAKKYRKMGIGSRLLLFFENQAIKMGKRKIILGAREGAEYFYLKKEYKPVLFLQIKHNQVPRNYISLSKCKILKETNYIDAKRLFIEVKKTSKSLKKELMKLFHAYNGIYLFEKFMIEAKK